MSTLVKSLLTAMVVIATFFLFLALRLSDAGVGDANNLIMHIASATLYTIGAIGIFLAVFIAIVVLINVCSVSDEDQDQVIKVEIDKVTKSRRMTDFGTRTKG